MANILVVDDDPDVVAFLANTLKLDGHETFIAGNGEKALETLREKPVDVVVTDIFMPEMDGLDEIIAITKDYPNVKIVAISGGGETVEIDLLSYAKDLGASKILHKPFSPRQLRDAVKAVLEG